MVHNDLGLSIVMGDPQNGWFIRENPNLKWMMTGGYPYFRKPPIVNIGNRYGNRYGNIYGNI